MSLLYKFCSRATVELFDNIRGPMQTPILYWELFTLVYYIGTYFQKKEKIVERCRKRIK